MREDDGFFEADVSCINVPQVGCGREQLRLLGGGKRGRCNPFLIESFNLLMKLFCAAVIVFEVGEVCERGVDLGCAKAGKERLFFVGIVAWAALLKVMKRGSGGFRLLSVECAAGGLLGDGAEDVKEAFDAAVTI